MAIFYIVVIGMELVWENTCGQLAIDYCSFWSAAQIANHEGYSEIYNLDKMEELQRSISPQRDAAKAAFVISPTVYLPIFIMPFQLLSRLNPHLGFWIWNLINIVVFILYLQFFAKEVTDQPLTARMLLMILLSLPVFLNLFVGQVNFWLAICVGEFFRASITAKPFRAGLWLGGLMLKPQFLVLIGLALLIQRSKKTLAGFAVSSLIIIIISFAMIGADGFLSLIRLWFGFAGGIPTNDVEIMMNWRMIGLNLSTYLGPSVSWTIAILGIATTTVAFIYIWRYFVDTTSSSFAVALLGTFAATWASAWHSHVHSAVILIPPLIYILHKKIGFPEKAFLAWVFIPPAFRLLALVLAALIQTRALPNNMTNMLNFLTSISAFVLNIYLLAWVTKYFQLTNQAIKGIRNI